MKDKKNESVDQIMKPLVNKFGEKEKLELNTEINMIKRHLRLLCSEFPNLEEQDVEIIRKMLLTLKIITNILEGTLNIPNFSFSWEEIIENLLYLEKDPNFMIKSMIREMKRRDSFQIYLLSKTDKDINKLKFNLFQLPRPKQRKLTEFNL